MECKDRGDCWMWKREEKQKSHNVLWLYKGWYFVVEGVGLLVVVSNKMKIKRAGRPHSQAERTRGSHVHCCG